ncbi:MAG: LamG-like jellyroll fold domain-containing protein, partial [Kiritimatiellia bacterium]
GVGASARAGRVSVPAYSDDPQFRILIYPHRQGDPLPDTAWNEDRSKLKVAIGDQVDHYTFSTTDGGEQADAKAGERVVFVMQRDDKVVARSEAAPPAPRLAAIETDGVMRNVETIGYDFEKMVGGGVTRFAETASLILQSPADGRRIEYRMNGGAWKLYTGKVDIDASAKVEARTVPVEWIYGDETESPLFKWDFLRMDAAAGDAVDQGLYCRVYEYRKDIYDERGFYTGKDPLIHPDLVTADTTDDSLEPVFDGPVEGLYTPPTKARLPMEEMAKASYLYTGVINVTADGVHYLKLNAPGPLYLDVNGERVIDNSGPHRMDQHDYITSLPLKAGTHRFTLLVTDPVYWKGEMEKDMDFSLSVLRPDSPPPARYEELHGGMPEVKPLVIGSFTAVKQDVKPGFLFEVYNRVGRGERGDFDVPNNGLAPDYFDVDGEQPVHRTHASGLESNYSLHGLMRYTGFYRVAVPGIYRFRLDPQGCNQIRIHGNLIWQNRVDAEPLGEVAVELDAGWHPIDLRYARSSGNLQVKTPLGDTFEPVNPVSLAVSADLAMPPLAGDALLAHGLVAEGPGVHRDLPMARNVSTVMMWVRQDAKNGKQVENLFDVEGNGVYATTRIRFGANIESGHPKGGASISARHDVQLGEWYHLAVTHDEEAIKVFVNGEVIGKAKFDLPSRNHHFDVVTIDPEKIKDHATLEDIRIYNLTPSPALLRAVMQASDPRR